MDGALILNKPAGITSHDVVARVRRIIGQRRIGHTGTLDPFATGVLVVLVGSATRLLQFLSGAEREYEAVIRFGYATDTGDVTGERLNFHANSQSTESLRAEDVRRIMNGMDLRCEPATWTAGQAVRLRGAAGELIAVGIYNDSLQLVHPQVVLST